MTLGLSGSYSEPSLLGISAKNRERCSFSSLALHFRMSSLRSLGCHPHLPNTDPSLHSFDFTSVDWLFGELSVHVFHPWKFPGTWPPFFFKTKNKDTCMHLCCRHGCFVIDYYTEIPPLLTNQISEISWLLLIGQLSRSVIGRLSVKPWCCWLWSLVMSLVHFDPSAVTVKQSFIVSQIVSCPDILSWLFFVVRFVYVGCTYMYKVESNSLLLMQIGVFVCGNFSDQAVQDLCNYS